MASASRMTACSASSPFKRSVLPTALVGSTRPTALYCSRTATAASARPSPGRVWRSTNVCKNLARTRGVDLAWHLPDDFRSRPPAERARILSWVRANILSGGTAYSLYHSEVSKHRFSLRFDDGVIPQVRSRSRKGCLQLTAPAALQAEMSALVRFKSSTLTEIGYHRSGAWGDETAAQRGEHLALLFGAMAASPSGEVRGLKDAAVGRWLPTVAAGQATPSAAKPSSRRESGFTSPR